MKAASEWRRCGAWEDSGCPETQAWLGHLLAGAKAGQLFPSVSPVICAMGINNTFTVVAGEVNEALRAQSTELKGQALNNGTLVNGAADSWFDCVLL